MISLQAQCQDQKKVFNGAATVDDTPVILLQVDMFPPKHLKTPNLCGIQRTWKFSSSKVMQEDGSGLMSQLSSSSEANN